VASEREPAVRSNAWFRALRGLTLAYNTAGFSRNSQDTRCVLILTNLLGDHLPDRFALGGRGLGQHDADARRGDGAFFDEILERGVFEGERMAFDRHLSETRLRERALQHMGVSKTECSWAARGQWGDL